MTEPPLQDVPAGRKVTVTEHVHTGMVWDVVRDTVDLDSVVPGAGTVSREYLRHPGAVGVLVLDDRDRVLLQRQYRHPVRRELWELPAGLLDVSGEAPLAAAQRELAEEADLVAAQWHLLLDWFNTPGGSDESFRLYLARDVTRVPEADRHSRTDEEIDMPALWVPLDQARDAVLAGRLHSPTAVTGVLAACVARDLGWTTLLPADTQAMPSR